MQQAAEIKALRQALGLTQEALARRIGVSWSTVAKWEMGRSNPSPLAREKIDKLQDEARSR